MRQVLVIRRLVACLLALFVLAVAVDAIAADRVRVRGYYRKDGTYVRPHYRTKPDGNPYNNYSFPGNYNPNTGRITGGNPNTYLDNYGRQPSSNPYRSRGSSDSLWND